MTEFLPLIAGIAIAAAVMFAWQWWVRGRALKALRARLTHVEMSMAATNRIINRMTAGQKEKEAALSSANQGLAQATSQVAQLRDLVKVHVARRLEFDEWANPIRASLGEGIAKVMQELKDKVARQEFSMQRQERVVAEARDQYRGKRDELERMRRELTLKNYHIAALNERFIRIEERMQELSGELGVESKPAQASPPPPTLTGGEVPAQGGGLRARPADSPETERFTLESDANKDWMGVLDDWHRQLQERFERLGELQAQIRGGGNAKPAPEPVREQKRDDSAA
jgi:hypothetical protein